MSTTEHTIDMELVDRLTKEETAALDAKHARSLAYRGEAAAHLPGGVSSSWQMWPPHPIDVSHGRARTCGISTGMTTSTTTTATA